jgi:hypothetical protein
VTIQDLTELRKWADADLREIDFGDLVPSKNQFPER